jgi:hypothetical protein
VRFGGYHSREHQDYGVGECGVVWLIGTIVSKETAAPCLQGERELVGSCGMLVQMY